MYVREVKSGGHAYLSLAHNRRDPDSGQVKAEVLYNFGRKDRIDQNALRRLVRSLARFLEPGEVKQLAGSGALGDLGAFVRAKRLGGTHVLDGIWARLGIDEALRGLLKARRFRTKVERLLFALVAQRALNPGSKLDVESWVRDEMHVNDLERVDVQQLYRSMDFLLEAHDEIQREVFWHVRNLFNLEVDVIFLDTTSVYFEIEGEDEAPVDDEAGNGDDGEGEGDEGAEGAEALRMRGHSKDARPDLAQAVVAFAVTRDGIPVRCWVWPGNTADVNVIEEVKRDLNDWKLDRVIVVADTGFNSQANRRTLQGAADAYILGEKLRLGPNGTLPEALRRPGRYKTLQNGLRIKEVTTQRGSVMARRFVVVHNPEQAKRDQAKRDEIVADTEMRLANMNQLDGEAHTKAACDLRAHPSFGRYVRQTKTGLLRLDKGKIAREAKLDGKFLVSTSDPHLPAEDVAMGYKQLHEVERVHRDLKHTVDVRPVYHRRADRIRAHMILCWLALLLIRVAENETGRTWFQLKRTLHSLSVAEHTTEAGPIVQTNRPNTEQKAVLDAVNLRPPPRYLAFPTPTKAA